MRRDIGAFAVLPNAAAVAAAIANGTFNAFASALEGVHNSGHVWVGGSMGSVPTAPGDPVFWMHHAEIDGIWFEWQKTHPRVNPALVGAAAVMDPWTETEVDTRDAEIYLRLNLQKLLPVGLSARRRLPRTPV